MKSRSWWLHHSTKSSNVTEEFIKHVILPRRYLWRPKWCWVRWVGARREQIPPQWKPTKREFETVSWSFRGVCSLAFVKPCRLVHSVRFPLRLLLPMPARKELITFLSRNTTYVEKFVLLKNLGDWEFLSQNRKLYLTQHYTSRLFGSFTTAWKPGIFV